MKSSSATATDSAADGVDVFSDLSPLESFRVPHYSSHSLATFTGTLDLSENEIPVKIESRTTRFQRRPLVFPTYLPNDLHKVFGSTSSFNYRSTLTSESSNLAGFEDYGIIGEGLHLSPAESRRSHVELASQ